MSYECDFLQHCGYGRVKKPVLLLLLIAGLLLAYFNLAPRLQGPPGDQSPETASPEAAAGNGAGEMGTAARGTVLDVSVHSLEELQLLLDRAEELAMRPQPQGENAGVVLVLHGPEVEYFAISNYPRYKDIVDKAARLDAFDVVDVKICQTMMKRLGVSQDDIPAFIEQVPYGPGEVERLVREGYIYF